MMASVYRYEIYGLEPVKVVDIVANSKRHAEKKLENVFPEYTGRKLEGWKFIEEEDIDDYLVA
jgi:hypothetical protein